MSLPTGVLNAPQRFRGRGEDGGREGREVRDGTTRLQAIVVFMSKRKSPTRASPSCSPETSKLPKGWIEKESRSRPGLTYYFHVPTGEASWAHPAKRRRGTRQEPPKVRRIGREDLSSFLQDFPSGFVHCLHLLKKHKESRKPSSWREKNISISREEAQKQVLALRDRILESATGEATSLHREFRQLAAKESDCSSASRGGDLGFFEFTKMQRPFAEAAFALVPGEMSEPVSTASGEHIILRLE